jgi:hypothetical protein
MNNRPVCDHSSETQSHPTVTNNCNISLSVLKDSNDIILLLIYCF